ncbi:hypothetical protein AB0G74_04220 [Streptomyces sp. NPDC020875]|uniref:RICIN domain-containing protein n=1 Tax=Streptomyces sp. NPDC020875 TaxID=3154898 RepID=UPI0033FEEC79
MRARLRVVAATLISFGLALVTTPGTAQAQGQIIRLRSVSQDKCLYFHSNYGKHVGVYQCVGYSDQRFELLWPGDNQVQFKNVDHQACLNIYSLEGAEVEAGSCGNFTSRLRVDGSLTPGQVVKIYFLYDGVKHCLDVNEEVLSWHCHDIDRQLWEVLSG